MAQGASKALSFQTVPRTCTGKFIVTNITMQSECGVSIQSIDAANALDYYRFNQICSPGCEKVLGGVINDLNSSECRDEYFDTEKDLTGKKLAAYFLIGSNMACVKTADNNGYCLQSQFPKLIPIISTSKSSTDAALGIIGNRDITCTDCFQKQLEIIKKLPLSDLDSQIGTGLKALSFGFNLYCPNIATVQSLPIPPKPTSTSTTTFTNSPTPTQTTQSGEITISSSIFITFLVSLNFLLTQ